MSNKPIGYNRRYWVQKRQAEDPDWRPRTRGIVEPVWDETVLTERWEDRKARLAKERGQ